MLALPPVGVAPGQTQAASGTSAASPPRQTQRAQTETGPPPYEPPAPPVSLDSPELAVTQPRKTVLELAFGGGSEGHADSLTVATELSDADQSREASVKAVQSMVEHVANDLPAVNEAEARQQQKESSARAAEQAYAQARAAADIEVPPILSKAV